MQQVKIIKIVLGGAGGSGKSTLLNTLQTGLFDFYTPITIGVDLHAIPILVNPSLTLMFYDLGGVKRFHFLYRNFIQGLHSGVVFYDLMRWETFNDVSYWINLIQDVDPDIPIIIVGAKKDGVPQDRLDYYQANLDEFLEDVYNPNAIEHHLFISSKHYAGSSAFLSYLVHLFI